MRMRCSTRSRSSRPRPRWRSPGEGRCCAIRAMPSSDERSASAPQGRRPRCATSSSWAPGPAGLAAALYAASEGLDVQGVDAIASGGQAGTSARIENYLGFPAGLSGSELTQRATVQAAKFGARLSVPAAAVALTSEPGRHEIQLSNGETATGRSVIVATGAQYRRLDVPRMEEFEGGGVYYAATQAEAQLCAGDPVVIVGGGNSAGQAAMFLSRHAGHCRLLIRGGDLGKSMSRYLVDQIERNDSVEVLTHAQVVELDGERELEAVTIADTRSGERSQAAAARAVRLHRRLAAHRVARGPAGDRPRRVPVDGPGRSGRGPRRVQRRSSPTSWRPAAPGSSPSATSTRARSSESPRPWGRARWPFDWSTNDWPRLSRDREPLSSRKETMS